MAEAGSPRERLAAEVERGPIFPKYPAIVDLDFAVTVALEQVEEWNHAQDPHGWCHQRPILLTLLQAALSDDSESMDTFMLGVLARQHHEAHYGENRPDYLLALAWVLDNWRAEDDPARRRLALIAEAISTASAQDSASREVHGG